MNLTDFVTAVKEGTFEGDEIDLRYSKITQSNIDELIQALKNCPQIKKIDLSSTGIGIGEIKKLVPVLNEIGCAVLDLSGNALLDESIATLVSLTTLKELDLSYNEITHTGSALLASALTGNLSQITVLNLSANEGVGDKGIAPFSDNGTLVELRLNGCRITDKGVEPLAHQAAKGTLKTLFLDCNWIHGDGLKHFENNQTLEKLYLLQNGVNNKGAKHLANTKLQSLDLSSGLVDERGVSFLAKNTSLRHLSLAQTQIKDKAAAQRILATHPTLKTLTLEFSHFIDMQKLQAESKEDSSNNKPTRSSMAGGTKRSFGEESKWEQGFFGNRKMKKKKDSSSPIKKSPAPDSSPSLKNC